MPTENDPPATPPSTPHARHAGLVGGSITAALATAVVLALVLSGASMQRAAFDQNSYHLPTVELLADPPSGLRDALTGDAYLSATTPLYHLSLTPLAGTSTATIRIAAGVWTVALLAILGVALSRRIGPVAGVAFALPLLANLYTAASAGWLLPDNAGWLGVVAVMLAALAGPRRAPLIAAAGLALALTVCTRQIHIWAAAMVWAGAWLADTESTETRWSATTSDAARRTKRLAAAIIATAPAFALLGAFAAAWGGLVPPNFQGGATDPVTGTPLPANAGRSPAYPAVSLALVALVAPFFLPLIRRPIIEAVRSNTRSVALLSATAGTLAFLVAAVPHTSYDVAAGRFSGVWNLTTKLEFADRSPILIVLATLGGVAIALWSLAVPVRTRLVLMMGLGGLALAQTMTANAWPRYVEPFILIAAAVATADACRAHKVRPGFGLALPVLLAAGLAAITLTQIRW